MTPELTVLALAGLLQVVQFFLMAVPVNMELGTEKTASPRDPDQMGGKSILEQVSPKTGRLARAMSNHYEGLILFILAVVVTTLSGQSTAFTAACAYGYLGARILYIPAYYFGWSPWRSVIWAVGFIASALMMLAALL